MTYNLGWREYYFVLKLLMKDLRVWFQHGTNYDIGGKSKPWIIYSLWLSVRACTVQKVAKERRVLCDIQLVPGTMRATPKVSHLGLLVPFLRELVIYIYVYDDPMVDCITVCVGSKGLYALLVISFFLKLNEMFEKKEINKWSTMISS